MAVTVAATYQGSPRKESSVISRATISRSRWYPPPFYRGEKREVLFVDSHIQIPIFNGLIVCNEDRKKVKEITLSLFSFLLTITDVICWSRNTRIDAKIAGMADARIIHHGFFSLIGLMIQPRSGLVGCNIIEHVLFNYLIFIVYIVTRFLQNNLEKNN